MAEAPIPRCNCCHTRDVAILLECHNSACSHYATSQRIYEGWHSKQAAPAAVAGPSDDLVTRESAMQAIEHLAISNSPGREDDAIAMLAAAPTAQPAPAVDWSQVGVLMEAHATTRQFLVGTTNWAAAICRYMTKHAAMATGAPQPGAAYAALPEPHFGKGRYLGLANDADAYSVAQVSALFASHGQAPAPTHFCDEAHVAIPQMLLGAACSAIDKKRDGTKVLAELRRYTTGDLSRAIAPAPAAVAGPGVRRIERTYFPNSPAHRALAAFCHAMHDNNIDGADMRAAMLWFLGLEEYEEQAAEIDPATMALAESVGLIGPASRTHDLHGAIQRFHDLICANATIKAAQMAAEAISEAAPQQEPVAWANWKVGSTSYAPYRTREQAVASVNQSGIAATQEGPYEVVALYTAPQTSPASQGDALDAARWRWLSEHIQVAWNEGKFTSLVRIVSEQHRQSLNASVDRMMAGDWSDAARSAQEGK